MKVKEIIDAKENSISDINIAVWIIDYAMTYNDSDMILKIKPELVKDALIKYINTRPDSEDEEEF